jgi:uncharacterized protein
MRPAMHNIRAAISFAAINLFGRRHAAAISPTAIGRGARLVPILLACLALAPLSARPAAAAEPGSKIRIAFAGDSLADNYWAGVTRLVGANACLRNILELGRFARNSTGLSRGDRVYWPREIKRIGDTFKPRLFVLSIGLNDRQFIVDGNNARTAWGAPDWTDKYRRELDAFLKNAATNAAVLMVGLPKMRDAVDDADAGEKNRMFAEAVARLGLDNVAYVEPWTLKTPDAFASYGPDKSGRLVQIRTPDGQHFATAGEDILAAYIFPKIVAALAAAGVRTDACPNIQARDGQ